MIGIMYRRADPLVRAGPLDPLFANESSLLLPGTTLTGASVPDQGVSTLGPNLIAWRTRVHIDFSRNARSAQSEMATNQPSDFVGPERTSRKHSRTSATEFCNKANTGNGAAAGPLSR